MALVAPVTHETLLHELSRRGGTEIATRNGSDRGSLEISAAGSTGADLKRSLTDRIIEEVIAVRAVGCVKVGGSGREERGIGQRLAGADRTDIEELPVEGVVELEEDGGVVVGEVVR